MTPGAPSAVIAIFEAMLTQPLVIHYYDQV